MVAGFVSAAAITIISIQVIPLTGLEAEALMLNFITSMRMVIKKFPYIKCADTLTGILTIVFLISLKMIGRIPICNRMFKFLSRSRYLILIIVGIAVAHSYKMQTGQIPFQVTDAHVEGKLPFRVPPLTAVYDNTTLQLKDMVEIMGLRIITIPIISVLHTFVVAKVFGEFRHIFSL